MKKALSDRVRLLHILQATTYVDEFLSAGTGRAIRFERQLEIIGEAVNHLSDAIKATAPDMEWRRIVAF